MGSPVGAGGSEVVGVEVGAGSPGTDVGALPMYAFMQYRYSSLGAQSEGEVFNDGFLKWQYSVYKHTASYHT